MSYNEALFTRILDVASQSIFYLGDFGVLKIYLLFSIALWALLIIMRFIIRQKFSRKRYGAFRKDVLIVLYVLPMVMPAITLPFALWNSHEAVYIFRAIGYMVFTGVFISPVYVGAGIILLLAIHPCYLSRKTYSARLNGVYMMALWLIISMGYSHSLIWYGSFGTHLHSTAALGFALAFLVGFTGMPYVYFVSWALYKTVLYLTNRKGKGVRS